MHPHYVSDYPQTVDFFSEKIFNPVILFLCYFSFSFFDVLISFYHFTFRVTSYLLAGISLPGFAPIFIIIKYFFAGATTKRTPHVGLFIIIFRTTPARPVIGYTYFSHKFFTFPVCRILLCYNACLNKCGFQSTPPQGGRHQHRSSEKYSIFEIVTKHIYLAHKG